MMIFGLNSSGWASEWSLDQLLFQAQAADMLGIELQMGTAHGVDVELDAAGRERVQQRVVQAGLQLIGIATDERVDHADDDDVAAATERLHEIMQLSHDIGGIGVTVRAAELPDAPDRDAAIERIGKTLSDLADFGLGWGQQVRVELWNACAEPSVARRILNEADHFNVMLAWSSRPQDISEQGLAHDFETLADKLGETVYVGPLDEDVYPYFDLVQLLREADYLHWVLLRTEGARPANVTDVLVQQRRLLERIASD